VLLPEVNGFAMLVASTDVGIGQELALYRIHEPMATKLLRGFVPTRWGRFGHRRQHRLLHLAAVALGRQRWAWSSP
jgi:hypothetical protein